MVQFTTIHHYSLMIFTVLSFLRLATSVPCSKDPTNNINSQYCLDIPQCKMGRSQNHLQKIQVPMVPIIQQVEIHPPKGDPTMVTLAHSGRPRSTLAIMAAPSSWRNGPCWTSVKMFQLGIWPKNSNMWYIRISQVEASSPYGATKRPCWDMLNPLQQPYVYNMVQ